MALSSATHDSITEPPGVPTGSQPLYAFWRTINYLLVFLGFLSLALTGELHPIAMTAFAVVWSLGLFVPNAWDRAPLWLTRPLFWLPLGAIALVALQIQFSSVLYLLLFLGLYKCLTLRTVVDHMHTLLLSFFMLLACSIITESMSYIIFIVSFIVLIMLHLLCFALAQASDEFSPSGEQAMGIAPPKGFFRRLFWICIGLACVVIVMGYGIFLLMPHYASNRGPSRWVRQSRPSESISGYTDELTLNAINRIQLDQTQVMKVRLKWPAFTAPQPISGLYVRGATLAHYSENKWGLIGEERRLVSDRWRTIHFPVLSTPRGPVVIQEINHSIWQLQRIFGVGQPFLYDFSIPERYAWVRQDQFPWWVREKLPTQYNNKELELTMNWEAQEQLLEASHAPVSGEIHYRVHSRLNGEATPLLRRYLDDVNRPEPPAGLLLQAGKRVTQVAMGLSPYRADLTWRDNNLRMSVAEQALYTQMPEGDLTDLLRELSHRQAPATSIHGKIVQLVDWFHQDFQYSLAPEIPEDLHPVAAFLTQTQKGHCEYFATSLALLLRVQGIPTRLVTGFYATEGDAKTYIVRQSDAHAWTEVWINGLGWLTIDPTPPDMRGRVSILSYRPSFWEKTDNVLRSWWQQYILDYSQTYQMRVYYHLLRQDWIETTAIMLQGWANRWRLGGGDPEAGFSQRAVILIIRTAVLTALALGFYLIYRLLRRMLRTGPAPRFDRSTIQFMDRLVRRLQRLGWPRAPGQTIAEYLLAIDRQTDARWKLAAIVDTYHRCRYAGDSLSPEESARIHRLIHELK